MGCGAELEANKLITDLTQDAVFPIPNIDLTGLDFKFPSGVLQTPLAALNIADVTDTTIEGAGAFDVLMRGYRTHLDREFEDNRITGDEYAKTFIALTQSAMAQAMAFVMGKDSAFWQSAALQVQAYTARIEMETAKAKLAATQYDAANQKAAYALTKMKMSTESNLYCQGQFTLNSLLPAQLDQITIESAGKTEENKITAYTLSTMLPAQLSKLTAETAGQVEENKVTTYNLSTVLPAQNLLLQSQKTGQDGQNSIGTYNLTTMMPAQLQMIKEQTEAQRAQTLDNRLDGAEVVGVLGKQKALYSQQVISYQRDSELKAARIWSDAWITQKTIDEGLTAPTQFTNAEVDKVLTKLRTSNGLT